MARRWRRNFVRALLAVTLGLGVAIATLPWWWPAIVERIGGVSIKDAVTSGWSTVELRGVDFQRPGIRVQAASLRVPAFGIWPEAGANTAVVGRDVVVTLSKTKPRPNAPPPSARRIVADILRVWPQLERWAPSARVNQVTINPAGDGSVPVRLSDVSWDGHRLQAKAAIPGRNETASVTLARPNSQTLQLTANVPDEQAQLDARAHATDQRLELEGDLAWHESSAQVTAEFGDVGLMPRSATLEAPTVKIPGAQVGMPAYGPITGSAHGTWNGHAYSAKIVAQADPVDPSATVPPLAVDVQANGNLHHVSIASAKMRIPGVDANLSDPLELSLPQGTPAAPATFSITIDLAKLPHVAASGSLTGKVKVSGGPQATPSADFSLTGSAIQWRDGSIPAIAVAGTWQPERLQITRGDVNVGESSDVHVTSDVNLRDHRIAQAVVKANVTAAALRPWLPRLPTFARLTLDAKAHGPWAAPDHSGTITWQDLAGMPGGNVDGDLSWHGSGISSAQIDGTLHGGGNVSLPLAVTVTREADGALSTKLTRLAWQDAQGEWWHLGSPATVRVGPAHVQVDGLRLAGEGLQVAADANVQWPARGEVNVVADQVAVARLAPLLAPRSLPATLDHLQVKATWDHGPVHIDGALRGTYAADASTQYSVEARYQTESDHLVFGSVRIFGPSGAVLEGKGRLPLRLAGRKDGFVANIEREGKVSLQLDSTPNPAFWDSLTRATGWRLNGPNVHAQLQGTMAAPEGRLEFSAKTVRPPPGVTEAVRLPEVGNVSVVAIADDGGLNVNKAIWTLDGNWVSLSGRAPWSVLRGVKADAGVPWHRFQFSFAADRLPMTIASRAVPRVLGPDGTVSFKIDHEPQQGFDGFLWLDGLALRPVQPLGAVRDIGGRVLLEGEKLTLRNVAAFLGGRPVELGGTASIGDLEHPNFDFRVVSARVPLVRQQGLVVRAGLNLRVHQTPDQPAAVSGTVDLGRSVFVSDLVSLLPTGGNVATPEQRPPFFSVPAEPFAEWKLDVDLHGKDFLQIQSPFFRAEASADFKLVGTLGQPRAQGRAWTDNGTIIFPFGSLDVKQAEVSLTPEQPYALALSASAATRIYGYDIHLQASGTAQDPRLQFSSEPPLSSQQVFLMLSAGELPQSENAFSTTERAQRLAWFVARNIASTFGIGGGEGNEKLTVRSGEDFSREGSETVYVQYDLNDTWALVGEKDRFDAYNAGIKYRIIDK